VSLCPFGTLSGFGDRDLNKSANIKNSPTKQVLDKNLKISYIQKSDCKHKRANVCGCFCGWLMDRIRFWAIALVGIFMFIDFLPPA
jgi:hypothetical protein